jgi:hypothetical protein
MVAHARDIQPPQDNPSQQSSETGRNGREQPEIIQGNPCRLTIRLIRFYVFNTPALSIPPQATNLICL